MWQMLSRSVYLTNLNFTNLASKVTRSNIVFRSKPDSLLLKHNQVLLRYQSTTPVGSAKPVLPQFEKKIENSNMPIKKKSKFFQFMTAFASGVVGFYAISYYLGYKKNQSATNKNSIDYNSQNLPGLIKPSKSVKIIFLYISISLLTI